MKKTLLLIAMMLPAYAAHSSLPGIPGEICCSHFDTVDYLLMIPDKLYLAGKVALIAFVLSIGVLIILRKTRTNHVASQKSHAVILGPDELTLLDGYRCVTDNDRVEIMRLLDAIVLRAAERGHTKYTQENTVMNITNRKSD